MKKLTPLLPNIISYFYIFLWVYAGMSKVLDFENFQVQLAQSPLLSAYAGIVSYAVIILEIIIAIILCFSQWRIWGLYASYTLMVAMTTYIFLILNYSDFIPCSCGGILEKMTWTQHLVFNIACVILSVIGIIVEHKDNKWFISKLLLMLFVIAVSGMIALFMSSEHIMKKENNFTRRFLPHPLTKLNSINLNSNNFYFAGHKGDTIFLGNYNTPLLMTTVFSNINKVTKDTLSLNEMNLTFQKIKLEVNYPHFSITDGKVPAIFIGIFPNKEASRLSIYPFYFSKFKKLSNSKFVFKTTLSKNKKSALGILDISTKKIKIRDDILIQQIDGLFDTDGGLITNSNKIIYTYLYRNQYIIIDDKLDSISYGKTIDTTSIAQIKLHSLSNGATKMIAPPLKVNEYQTTHNNILFNISRLKGKYESNNKWKNNKVVDLYDLSNSNYLYSIYIEKLVVHY